MKIHTQFVYGSLAPILTSFHFLPRGLQWSSIVHWPLNEFKNYSLKDYFLSPLMNEKCDVFKPVLVSVVINDFKI